MTSLGDKRKNGPMTTSAPANVCPRCAPMDAKTSVLCPPCSAYSASADASHARPSWSVRGVNSMSVSPCPVCQSGARCSVFGVSA